MAETKQFDLTEGPILSKLLFIAVPIMGTQLFQMLYNFVDMFFLGQVSSDAVAASGTAGMYVWLSAAFLMFGRMGAEIGVAQSFGRKNDKEALRYSQNSIFIALLMGTIFGGMMIIFSHPLIGFFQIQEVSVAQDAASYLRIVAVGIPLTFISAAINGAFTGAGNSKLPFYINVMGIIFNIIISPLFIMTLGWGIQGAALATILAQALVFALFGLAIKFHSARPFEVFSYSEIFKPNRWVLGQIFRWSFPISLESLCFTLLSMIIARFIAIYGAGAIATQRVGSQIESLSYLIGGGFASALTAFIGQNFGAGKWERIHQSFKIATAVMISWGIFVSLMLFFGAEFLFSLFISEPDIILLGIDYLRIFSLAQLATCIEALAAGAFRGVGITHPPSIVSISFNVLRVLLAYVLVQTTLGINGIWWAMTVGNICRGVVLMVWYLLFSRKQPNHAPLIAVNS